MAMEMPVSVVEANNLAVDSISPLLEDDGRTHFAANAAHPHDDSSRYAIGIVKRDSNDVFVAAAGAGFVVEIGQEGFFSEMLLWWVLSRDRPSLRRGKVGPSSFGAPYGVSSFTVGRSPSARCKTAAVPRRAERGKPCTGWYRHGTVTGETWAANLVDRSAPSTGQGVSFGLLCCGVTKLRIVLRSVTGREMLQKAA